MFCTPHFGQNIVYRRTGNAESGIVKPTDTTSPLYVPVNDRKASMLSGSLDLFPLAPRAAGAFFNRLIAPEIPHARVGLLIVAERRVRYPPLARDTVIPSA